MYMYMYMMYVYAMYVYMMYMYMYVYHYIPTAPNGFRRCTGQTLMQPLLEQKIPESYVKLQDIVRLLAHACSQQNRVPIFTRREYL